MSARIDDLPHYRAMTAIDLDAVMEIENRIYAHPWTCRNFSDSLDSGYHCWIIEIGGEIVGYSVIMIAANEAHLLNLGITAGWQRRGLGRELLNALLRFARDFHAHKIYLEVRPSNIAGRALYTSAGFREIGTRRGYYPAGQNREDAVVMELLLS